MRQKEVEYILGAMLKSRDRVSDINLTVGKPPQVEADGELIDVALNPPIWSLTPFQTEMIALNIMRNDPRLIKNLLENGSADCSFGITDKARFRVSIFSQRNTFSLVMRKLETIIPTIEELKLPPIFNKFAQDKNGLILFTGATGSGKSTSLAAILDVINREKSVHVVTLEDPVEFMHTHKKATFNQRELGMDFDHFASGLRAALRQAPKVILVGEMRDRETVEIGLSAAETGHLVLSTLHTVDAGQTINRIIGMFDLEEEKLIRIRLSESIRWVVSQRLLPKEGGGRVAVFEIMGTNLRVKDAILHGEEEGKTFYDIITAAEPFGWRTFDKSLVDSYKEGVISEDTALAYASRKSVVGRGLDRIKAVRGIETSSIKGDDLSIDDEYAKEMRIGFKKNKR
ncbi:Twitching motility protein PilT [hydrothermal vent metagenome]|uniref:Twitching motility protein PilT n=1 Tax=hydrothermal vent metagenome TaxID=652676 RepID=A0A3B1CMI5_9ZZZZ